MVASALALRKQLIIANGGRGVVVQVGVVWWCVKGQATTVERFI
jgi:hypothetical protein